MIPILPLKPINTSKHQQIQSVTPRFQAHTKQLSGFQTLSQDTVSIRTKPPAPKFKGMMNGMEAESKGDTAFSEGNYSQALHWYKDAQKKYNDAFLDIFVDQEAVARRKVASCYRELANQALNNWGFRLAEEYLTELRKYKDSVSEAEGWIDGVQSFIYNRHGVHHFERGNFQTALEYHQKELQLDIDIYGLREPGTEEAYSNVANCLAKLDRIEDAETYVSALHEIRGNSPTIQHMQAITKLIAISQKHVDEAKLRKQQADQAQKEKDAKAEAAREARKARERDKKLLKDAQEAQIKAQVEAARRIDEDRKAREAQETEEARVAELQRKEAVRAQQRADFSGQIEDLKIPIKNVPAELLSVTNAVRNKYPKVKGILARFDKQQPVDLTRLNESQKLSFEEAIMDFLAEQPKVYETMRSDEGKHASIIEIDNEDDEEGTPTAVPYYREHLIAHQALKQYQGAKNQPLQQAWKEMIVNWFGLSPEQLAEKYPDTDTLYDILMKSASQAVGFTTLAGLKDIKEQLVRTVLFPSLNPDSDSNYQGVLLYGEPGCGKSVLGLALAQQLGYNIYFLRRSSIASSYQDSLPEAVATVLDHAERNQPSVVIVDEAEAFSLARKKDSSVQDTQVTGQTSALLNGIDKLKQNKARVKLIMTSNFPDKIDPAVRRPGRTDHKIEMLPPDVSFRRSLFEKFLEPFTVPDREQCLDQAAELAEGLRPCDVETIHKRLKTSSKTGSLLSPVRTVTWPILKDEINKLKQEEGL